MKYEKGPGEDWKAEGEGEEVVSQQEEGGGE